MASRFYPHLVMLTLLVIDYVFESLIVPYKRSGSGFQSKDQNSLKMLQTVFSGSFAFALAALVVFPQARLPAPFTMQIIGVALFSVGLILRWSAVACLGRLFTVDVAIAENHELVEHGPYRFVRHPSYTGLLLIWLGMGFSSGNGLTLAALLLPTGCALLRRIRIEEAVLSEAFGSRYADYARRTWRLIPFIY